MQMPLDIRPKNAAKSFSDRFKAHSINLAMRFNHRSIEFNQPSIKFNHCFNHVQSPFNRVQSGPGRALPLTPRRPHFSLTFHPPSGTFPTDVNP